jgi:hypothetical protein
MKTAIALLCLSGAAWAQQRQGQEYPGSKGGKLKPAQARPEVSLRGGLELTYDDNILDLSERQQDEFKDGTRPKKYRIEEIDDVVASPWAELRLKARLIGDPTTFGLKAQANAYQENSFANYEEYRLFVHQPLGRHELGVEYDLDADVYNREYKVAVIQGVTDPWDSGFYTDHELELFYRHQVSPGLSVRPFAGYAVRDYESPFGYRDLRGYFAGVRPAVEVGPWTAFLQYRYESMEADASAPEDPDTSFREHQIEPGVGVALLDRRLELTLRYRVGYREYTSSDDPTYFFLTDPSYVDREDRRERVELAARFRLHKNWSVEGKYIRRETDSDQPFDSVNTSEAGTSERNLFVLGVSFAF